MAKKANDAARKTENENGMIEDAPQELTQSYGTGVHPMPGYNVGEGDLPEGLEEYTNTTPGLTAADEDAIWHIASTDEVGASPVLTGGDIDAGWQQAATVGDEAVGGTAPTPDQNVTEEIEAAVGLEMDDRAFLRTNEILEQRDDRRWDLDPMSSEDYQERQE